MNGINIFLCYLLAVNLAGFLLFGMDKSRARRHRWRIPEKTLFAVALLGGSLGCLAGMYGFRHKTHHQSFVLGIPVILVLQCVLVLFLFRQGLL